MKTKRKLFRSLLAGFFLLLCVSLASSIVIAPAMETEASWINRGAGSIYDKDGNFGQGIGDLNEDDAPEEIENDEGTNFFIKMINSAICWILSNIGKMLFSIMDGIGASLDQLIYGRLVTDTPLFTFDLSTGNVYGVVSAAMYSILRAIAVVLMIVVFMGKVALAAWKNGSVAKSSLRDAFTGFIGSALMLALMPNLVDLALFIRDIMLYLIGTTGATNLFGSESSSSIIAVLGAAANDNIVSSIIFIAAVVLNLYFLLGYVGVALSMTVDFVLFPFVVIKSNYDKSTIGNWLTEMLSCMVVPIVDAILIMLPSFLGIYASSLDTIDAFGVAVVQVIICYLIIPTRAAARNILGLRVNPLESSGLFAAGALGMAAARGLKNMIQDSKETRKNAAADQASAEMEDDLAKLEQEEAEGGTASAYAQTGESSTEKPMQGADEIMNKNEGLDGENGERNDDMPLGKEQSYAEGLNEHLNAEGIDPESEPLSPEEEEDLQRELQDDERKLADLEQQKKLKEAEKEEIANDNSLSEEEKGEKMAAVDKEIGDLDKQMQSLGVDGKLRAANKRKSDLEAAYEETANSADLDDETRNRRLDSLSDQISEVDNEIAGLQREKKQQALKKEMADLAKEPATLREEKAKLQASAGTIGEQRDQLVRERAALVSKQGEYAVDSDGYRDIAQKISGIDEQIVAKDMELGANQARQSAIDTTLARQESGLRDRQAYNLHERVKAQEAYDTANAQAADIRRQLKNGGASMTASSRAQLEEQLRGAEGTMEKAQSRIGSLAAEDRRIAARLHEISPELNQTSPDALRSAKNEQKVKRAGIQREIANLNAQMEADKNENRYQYREKIAKLKSEIADCDYKTAKIDQMLDGMKGGDGRGASGAGRSSISNEYDKKRNAIMERYATVDNFERPEFSNISHEKKAQLYRERALRAPKILFRRRTGAIAGAVMGAGMGVWLGAAGVGVGGMFGSTIGGEVGESMANRSLTRRTVKPVNYDNTPLDFHISSDMRDNTVTGQVRTVERVQAELAGSLESDKFQQAVQDELMDTNIVQQQIRVLFQENQVTPQNYEEKRDVLLKGLRPHLMETVEKAEQRIVRQCAGKEYASLSPQVQRQIVRSVAIPNMEIFDDLTEQYLGERWQPYYADYLK